MSDPRFSLPHYPSISDPNFVNDILEKLEYQEIVGLKALDDSEAPLYRETMFRLIGPSTPYNRLLIIHSVGTGKTACAIGIVEQYKKSFRQAIVLNKSDVPTDNFKELLNKYFQENNVSINDIGYERSFYKFDTYSKFCKRVSSASKELLKETFERTIFIMDEVHNVVTKMHNGVDKNYTILMSLFDLLENSIVVGMTATPMRDSYKEIIPLANMFIKNPKNRIQEKVENVSSIEPALSMFANTTVSWYRQSFDFEVLHFGNNSIELSMPTMELLGGRYQVETYKTEFQYLDDQRVSKTQEKRSFMDKKLIYASLAAFPAFGTNVEDRLVLEEKLDIVKDDGKIQCANYVFNLDHAELLEEFVTNPYRFSCKFAFTMSHLENDARFLEEHTEPWSLKEPKDVFKGLVYIFCEDIASTGIKTLMAMLQHFGYEYYLGGDIQTLSINYRRFTVYAGDKSICPNGRERLQTFRSLANENGKYCRIIIASNVMKESVSLKAIRKVFIWTSHWNYSAIVQAQGRAIRRDAFTNTNVERNVELYRLATVIDPEVLIRLKDSHEDRYKQDMRMASIDIYKYYKSTTKMRDIQLVEKILETQALDYHINNPTGKIDEIPIKDISTYVQASGPQFDKIKAQLQLKLSNNRFFHIGEMRKIFENTILFDILREGGGDTDVWIDLAIQYLDVIKDMPLRIGNVIKYLKVRNDIIFAVDNPNDREIPINVDAAPRYRKDHLSQYIDTRSILDPNFNWGMTRCEFVGNIKEYIRYKIDIIEQVVRIRYGKVKASYDMEIIKRFMGYLNYHLYCIRGSYYHLIEKSRVDNAKYSNNSSSISSTTIVRKYDVEMDCWITIDSIEFEDIAFRVKYIKIFRTLGFIVNYGLYGSYSLSDGELRIHNYDRYTGEFVNRDSYLQIRKSWIKHLFRAEKIELSERKQIMEQNNLIRKYTIRVSKKVNKYGDEINMNDLRTDKRGLNVNSHDMTLLVVVILKFYLYCTDEDVRSEFFNLHRKELGDIFYTSTELDKRVQNILNDHPDMRTHIFAKYLELKLIKSADILKKTVKDLITRSELYFIN